VVSVDQTGHRDFWAKGPFWKIQIDRRLVGACPRRTQWHEYLALGTMEVQVAALSLAVSIGAADGAMTAISPRPSKADLG